MAQKTFVDGDVLTASDLNTYCSGEGGAWTSWTPTVTQSSSVTFTNNSAYARYGRLIVARFNCVMTASGTAGNAINLSLPVTASTSGIIIGNGYLGDASTGGIYGFNAYLSSTTNFQLFSQSSDVSAQALGNATVFALALASSDSIVGTIMYEAAS